MASIIKIKRTTSAGAPGTTTESGELAYSYLAGLQNNGGDRLYIGNNTAGGNPIVIGGQYFTDMLDHVKGTLTASSAIITDVNSQVDNILVGDADAGVSLTNNIFTATSTTSNDLNLIFTPKADGVLRIVQQGTAGSSYEDLVLNDDDIPNKKYVDALLASQNSLTVEDDTNTPAPSPEVISLGVDVLRIVGGEGIDSTLSRVTDGAGAGLDYIVFTIAGEDASSSNKGIASFDGTNFTVTTGNVVANDITLGTTALTLGNTTLTLAGLQQVTIDELDIDGSTISAVGAAADLNINLSPKGTGVVNVLNVGGSQSKITNVADPADEFDAVNYKTLLTAVGDISTLTVQDDDATNIEVLLTEDIFKITGGTGITVTASITDPGGLGAGDNPETIIFTVAGVDATANTTAETSTKGVASFDSANFTVTSGWVEANDITLGSSTLSLGSTTLTLAGLEQLDVDNVSINGNTISSTDTDGDLILDANGAGNIDVNSNRIINVADPVDNLDAVNYQTLLDSVGDLATLFIQDDSNTDIELFLTEDTLRFNGGTGITVTAAIEVGPRTGTDPDLITFTVEGVDATANTTAETSTKGVASFDSANFTVTSGWVEANDITLGSSTLSLGSTTLTLAGLEQLTVDQIDINGNTISAVDTESTGLDININLTPLGNTGVVNVANSTTGESRITNVADPVDAGDAANKRYVDEVAQGLTIRPSARAGTTENLDATYANGTLGVGATLTATANGALGLIDAVGDTTPSSPIYGATQTDRAWAVGDLILVRSQTNKFENGLYEVTVVGDAGNPWVLTRHLFVDDKTEIPSSYVFIQEGDTLAGTGWAAIVEDFNSFDVGVDDIIWYQFSGAGSITASDGIDVVGTTISVDISATGSGLTFAGGTSGNALVVNPLIAGGGLTYDATGTGILNVVGTADRITVNADSVDIAATYIGQNTITTLGTVTTGTWNATTVTVPYGGTGGTTFTTNGVLYGDGANALKVTAAGTTGYFLYSNAGVPDWTNVVDGGTY